MNIRSLFYTVLFSLALLVPSFSFAQGNTPNSCDTITPQNYPACCSTANYTVQQRQACELYYDENSNTLCAAPGYGTPAFLLCCVVNTHPNCIPRATTPNSPSAGTGLPTAGTPINSGGTPLGTTTTNTATQISAECRQVMGPGGRIKSLLDIFLWIRCVISVYILPIIFSVAFIVFMYGVIKYVIAGDSKEKDEGKKFLMWGLIGLFVMVSVWGIVGLVSNTLGLENTVPQLQQNVYCPSGKKYDPVTQGCR